VKKLVVATRNPGKAREIAAMLSDLPVEVVSLADYPDYAEPPETGETFVQNAVEKARSAAEHTGQLALADDSGLVIDALGGQPGVYSSRFAGEGASDEQRCEKVLRLMQDVPNGNRSARFVCALAIAWPDGEVTVVEGTCEGVITRYARGTYGFGYDPIFFLPELGRTMAELPPEEKNRISHRARAMVKAREHLSNKLRAPEQRSHRH